MELLKDVDTVIFDKTGTLTLDQPEIGDIHTCAEENVDTVLAYAAAAEHRQTHPIARAILAEASKRRVPVPEVDGARYEMGFGLSVQLDDQLIRVGSERYMSLEQIAIPCGIQSVLDTGQENGNSLVMVAVDDQLVGAIELRAALRPEVKAVVAELCERQLRIVILSGDQEEPTRKLARELGISSYYANTFPEEKASRVAQLQAEGRSVCFVGDGINDSISLKKANVSISLRGASTAAMDSAQIVLMDQGLRQLPFILNLSHEFEGRYESRIYRGGQPGRRRDRRCAPCRCWYRPGHDYLGKLAVGWIGHRPTPVASTPCRGRSTIESHRRASGPVAAAAGNPPIACRRSVVGDRGPLVAALAPNNRLRRGHRDRRIG